MNNLRLDTVNIIDSSNIEATFTSKLINNLYVGNVQIISKTLKTPDAKVLGVKIVSNKLIIKCQPLTPYSIYELSFRSTHSSPFLSINGDSLLLEDGIGNIKRISGPPEPDNIFRNLLRNYLKDNIYNTDDYGSMIGKLIESYSNNFVKCLYDLGQIKNENYLSVTIEDEQKTRGIGPYDALNEKGCYEILRVATSKSGSKVSGSYKINYFNNYPFSLQSTSITKEILTIDSVDAVGKFNINNLILNLKNKPTIKLKNITFILNETNPIYDYPIDVLGYQIKDNRYDQDYAFKYLILEDNQIKLNDALIKNNLLDLESIIRIEVDYDYKDLGKIVYSDTLSVSNILTSSREPISSEVNIFDLNHAPIVDLNDKIPESNGIRFTNPNTAYQEDHPAFINEIPFRLEALPSLPGQYSVDYNNGRVYVYGSDYSNTGTGSYPPVASYNYRFNYQNNIDYVFDEGLKDIIAPPNGNLIYNPCKLSFGYEKVLVKDVDYVSDPHKESLSERVENRLLDLATIRVLNKPVKNVFRIYNETSGEIYIPTRWNDDKIYFDYAIPPQIKEIKFEKSEFDLSLNELIVPVNSYTNINNLKIFKILLNNNNIISLSEDCIGSSINSSASFSKINIFNVEKYFDRISSSPEDKLMEVGEYCIDYVNGVIYCAVSNTQDQNLGTVSYKNNKIKTAFNNVLAVDDIYYQVSPISEKNKNFNYTSYDTSFIVPDGLDFSDEQSYNNNNYVIFNNEIGYFNDTSFQNQVKEKIKQIRGLFERDDLLNNKYPINFYQYCTFEDKSIYFNKVTESFVTQVKNDGSNLYVTLPIKSSYISSNIEYEISILKNNTQFWDSNGQIFPGNQIKLILSGYNSPIEGDSVVVSYSTSIKNLSNIIIDYNKGDLYIDYSIISDEIIVSYEYGEDAVDFRQSEAISPNSTYYVTYKVGALRDGLLNNFGSLLNVNELKEFNINLERERYRDCISGALSSFLQGPTIGAIKNLVNQITHVDPEVIESVFNNWSLGDSLLYPNQLSATGDFSLVPLKFGNGVLIDQPNQSISLPQSSNLSIEQGTFETWVMPEWDGIDNDAEINLTITKDSMPVSSDFIFIGMDEKHPEIQNNSFSINKNNCYFGTPQMNKNGVYIYYAQDSSKLFNRWYVGLVDDTADGYNYSIQIKSSGKFYDLKNINILDGYITTTTLTNKATVKIKNQINKNQKITFICDYDHYLLDSGDGDYKNKLSIYKDVSGYLTFKVFDKFKYSYSASADVSNWKRGERHFVAASWKLNSENGNDEMHLFIDGFEVPNDIKYGQKLLPYPHEKFKTINPEIIIGSSSYDIVGGNDLSVTQNSYVVSSSISLGAYNINVGDTLYIDDPLFNPNGYTIYEYNGNQVTLSSPMPTTLSNLKFSINKTSFNLKLDAAVYSNISISTISVVYENNDLQTTQNSKIIYSASSNFINGSQQILPGYILRILNSNFDTIYNILSVDSDNQLTLDKEAPVSLNNLSFYIYSNKEKELPGTRSLDPYYNISLDEYFGSVLTINKGVFANDLILLNTFGLNFKKIKNKNYIWSDLKNSFFLTRLPEPISTNSVKIYKIIHNNIVIKNNPYQINYDPTSSYTLTQPINSSTGRTLTAVISGTAADFSNPIKVTIDGYNLIDGNISEYITFDNYGKLDFANKYNIINSIKIEGDGVFAFELREKFPITINEEGSLGAIIKYSYNLDQGFTLTKASENNTVVDENKVFSDLVKGNTLNIISPPYVAGSYKILDVIGDGYLKLDSSISSFSNGSYVIKNTLDTGTGVRNGQFYIEKTNDIGAPFILSKGFYEIEYESYLSIKMDPLSNQKIYFGSDVNKKNQAKSVLDQIKIYGIALKDTRTGEIVLENERSITKDYNSLSPLKADKNTLVLIDFDSYPFVNYADFYTQNIGKKFIQVGSAINNYFNKSLLLKDNSIVLDNFGVLDTKKEGTIEFWVNPIYDTQNDSSYRYYFDAYGAKAINSVSLNNSQIKINESIERVLSVTLENGDSSIDYFAGGTLATETIGAIEVLAACSGDTVTIPNNQPAAFQIISIKLVNDLSEKNYFGNGKISNSNKRIIYLENSISSSPTEVIVTYKPINGSNYLNQQIINLNKKLPKDNSSIIVKFIPKGFKGDRISIFKDPLGFLNFTIFANNKYHTIISPIYWKRNTWHRVKATYKVNSKNNSDEINLFIDGHEVSLPLVKTKIKNGLLSKDRAISIKDSINQIYIGSDYSEKNSAYCLINNLRLSNISRPIYKPYREPIDPYYSDNINTNFPVTKDEYTTYLLDFDNSIIKNENFASIILKEGNNFNFGINIFDSFGIVIDSPIIKQILEKLIKNLKPANSKVYLKYY